MLFLCVCPIVTYLRMTQWYLLHQMNLTYVVKISKSNQSPKLPDGSLIINLDKSCTMVVGSQQRITKYCFNDSLDIVYHNKSLSNKDSYCYLGLEIDSCLSWNNHITKLSKKLGPVIAQLQRIRWFLSMAQLTTLYCSFVQPHIDQILTIWGFSSKTNFQKIQRFQKRAACIITNNCFFYLFSHSFATIN